VAGHRLGPPGVLEVAATGQLAVICAAKFTVGFFFESGKIGRAHV
jgi:hypothetical protein